jgi:DNA-binding CsgD family transcriptional regulator
MRVRTTRSILICSSPRAYRVGREKNVKASSDLLDIVEAAYDVDAEGDAWLERLARLVRPHLDRGFGVAAFEYYRPVGAHPQILRRHHLGIPDGLAELYRTVFDTMDGEIRQRAFRLGPCVTGSQLMGIRSEFRDEPHMKRYVQRFGMFDSMWITAAEPSGLGCGFHAGRAQIAWATPAETRIWGRLAGHLATAVRLRARLHGAKERSETPAPDAVFDPDGNVQHASGPASSRTARELLRKGVLMLERSRGSMRATDPDGSLGGWKALVAGRWSLLDRLEEGGRRYVIARQNEPHAPGPDTLTMREKQVIGYVRLGHHNKLIAYELGVADSTVRVLLARAAAKLGVRTREELLQAVSLASHDA